MAVADLARFIDTRTVEYVRLYPHPIERVWRAITDPAEFGVWFIKGGIELRAGGDYHFESGDWSGKVLTIQPPRLIRFSSGPAGDGYFQYELAEATGGTRMRFVEYFAPRPDLRDIPADLAGGADGVLGGWHELFDSLGEWLNGLEIGTRLAPSDFSAIAAVWAREAVRSGAFDQPAAARHLRDLRRAEEEARLNGVYREHIRATCPPAEPVER